MATVLQTLTFPSSASLHSSPTHFAVKLTDFTGLKVRFRSSAPSSLRSVALRTDSTRRVSRFVCKSSDTTAQLASVTDDTFKSLVLESDLPVLVDFWAPWCGPCRIIEPVIVDLSKEYAGKLKVFKVNTDESPTIASDYGVRSIPTVIIFKNGDKKEAIIGAVPKSTLTSSIEKFL